MPRYTGVNHLALVTGNMDATIRFWRDLLGMPIVAGLGKPGYRQYFLHIANHSMLTFFEWDGVEPMDEKDHGYPTTGKVGFDHVSIGVESDDDLWELKDMLDAAGFWVSELVDHGFIHSLYSFDPNGIAIEFSCYVQHVDIILHPRLTAAKPSAVTLEGPYKQAGKWPVVTAPTQEHEKKLYPGEGHDFLTTSSNAWKNK
ncbi:VOC family protein [Oleidesulfovibrio sp.]|uniref:VOC family protein n=1 Tax=Oleidesulfovibrio sp. TaxID=2909707 RepID=UPI003A88C5B8